MLFRPPNVFFLPFFSCIEEWSYHGSVAFLSNTVKRQKRAAVIVVQIQINAGTSLKWCLQIAIACTFLYINQVPYLSMSVQLGGGGGDSGDPVSPFCYNVRVLFNVILYFVDGHSPQKISCTLLAKILWFPTKKIHQNPQKSFCFLKNLGPFFEGDDDDDDLFCSAGDLQGYEC